MNNYKGTYAASVIRVFDIVAACVGMNEKLVVSKNLPFASIHVHPGSHAGYFPGAKSINFKLVFNPENGAILLTWNYAMPLQLDLQRIL